MRKTPLALPALVLLASCGGGGETPLRCAADPDCGAPGEAYCRAGSCIANGAPRVTVRAPAGALQTNVLLRFEGTAADPEGEALTLRWTATPLSNGCAGDADAVTDAPPSADVALWCAGTYEVALAARDPWGHEGVARTTVAVAQAAGAPTVAAGTGYAVDHACAGDPLRCDALGAGGATQLPLSASASSPGGGVLSYEWRALAPGGAEAATAEFLPGPDAKSPAVSLHSAGTRLAGAWTMRVRARNEAGLLAQAAQVVTVTNHPPALSLPASLAADHVHDGSGYLAEALVAPAVADPDGDPVTSSFALSASAAHPCTHGFSPVGPNAAQLTLSCADPAQLIGTVAWGVHAVATDVNDATAEGDVSLEVRNRPPALNLGNDATLPSIATVAHAVGPCAGAAGDCFTTAGEPAVDVVDPDGDPLEISAEALGADPAAGSRGTASSDAAGVVRFRFEADLDRPDLFRGADGSSTFSVQVSATDVFGATAAGTTAIAIGNRPPAVALGGPASVPHLFDAASGTYLASATAAAFSDPDGDPLVVGDSGDATCASVALPGGTVGISCALPYVAGTPPPLASLAGAHELSVQVQDPWDLTARTGSLAIANAAPIAPVPYAVDVPTACKCACALYGDKGCELWTLVPRGTVPVEIRFAEPEGDPVRASVPAAAETFCFQGACTLPLAPGSHQVIVDDGVASAAVDVTVGFTCVDPPICG